MLNCLLIKKMESYSEMDLYYIMLIFHWDDLEQYVLLPVFQQMRLGFNLPVGHFLSYLKHSHGPAAHFYPTRFFTIVSAFQNLIMIFHFRCVSFHKQSSRTWLALAPSSFILEDSMLELPSVLLQTSGTFFHFVSSFLSCDPGELKSQCSIME